jgi:hypothetical protein
MRDAKHFDQFYLENNADIRSHDNLLHIAVCQIKQDLSTWYQQAVGATADKKH